MPQTNDNTSNLLQSFAFANQALAVQVDMIARELPEAIGVKPTAAGLTMSGHFLELGSVIYQTSRAPTPADQIYVATKGISTWAFSSWVAQNATAVAAVELPGRNKIFAPIVGGLAGISSGLFLQFGEDAINSKIVAKYIADNPQAPEAGGQIVIDSENAAGEVRKVVLSTGTRITQFWDNGSVVATIKQDASGNITQIETHKGTLSYSLDLETGGYRVWDDDIDVQGNLSDSSLAPSAEQALQQLIDLYDSDIQNIDPQFDILDQAPAVTVLTSGWVKLEGHGDTTYTKGGFSYTQNSSGGFEIHHRGVNAFYDADGTQVIAYQDAGTGRGYVLNIEPDGSKTFAYTGEPGKEFHFSKFSDLSNSAQGALQAALTGIDNAVGDKVQALFADNPSLQNTSDYTLLSGQDMQIVPPLPAHKPNVPAGEEDFSTKNGEAYDLTTETSVTIDGQTYALQRMSGLVDTATLTNADLVNNVLGTSEASLGAKNNDLRFQSMGELLARWSDDPLSLSSAGIAFVDGTNGGAMSKILQVGGQSIGSVTFVEKGAYRIQVLEAIGGPDSVHDIVQVITEDLQAGRGARSEVMEVIYPENFAFQYVGGYFGGVLASQLAQSNVFKQVIYNSLFTTAGQTAGTFTDFLSAGTLAKAALKASTNGMDTGINQDIPELSERFAANFSSALANVLGNAVVNELTDAVQIDGIGGELFDTIASTVTVGAIHDGLDFVFKGVSGGTYYKLFTQGYTADVSAEIKASIANALGAYIGGRLAGELIPAESKEAAILGSLGGGIASYFGGTSIANALAMGAWGGPVGIAIATFLGTIGGTVLGNLFAGDQKSPEAYAKIGYDLGLKDYRVTVTDGIDGGDSSVAESMAKTVINAVNHILDLTHGGLRTTSHAPQLSIGIENNQFFVADFGSTFDRTYFDRSGDAIEFAALKLLKSFDLVGGHAILMRAWYNTEATTLQEFQEDISVAEAFQTYLLNPTAVLALMMNSPQSQSAQQWAAILNRATELGLHIPHERDLEGGWGEILAARGDINPEAVPSLEQNNLVVTDPITGQQTTIEHVIGPGYEIVIREGTDGNDHIEIVVDGPSITYTDAGPGDDTFVGSNGADVFVGGVGNDTANGGGGNDWLYGGAGNDALYGEAGEDLVVGGDGDDTLSGGPDTDMVYGGAGNDTIYAAGGRDSIYGGSGNDIVHGDFGDANVTAYGGSGNDVMYGYGGSTSLNGGIGDDTFILTTSNPSNPSNFVRITRGDGNDVVDTATAQQNVYVTFDASIGLNELWFAQSGNDLKISVVGENQSVIIRNWWVDANVRSKTFINGVHQETPTLNVFSNGQPDRSVFYAFRLFATPSVIQSTYGSQPQPAGLYNQVANYNVDFATIWQMLAATYDFSTSTFSDYSSVNLTSSGFMHYPYQMIAPTVVTSTTGANYTHSATSPNPLIYLGTGATDADILGANLNDTMYGGNGNDHLDGKAGDDIISGGAGADVIHGEEGNDRLYGGIGDDSIHDQRGGNDALFGGVGNDLLEAGDGEDTLFGEEGDDIMDGGSGGDNLFGGAGADILFGSEGNDSLRGDDGDDTLYGGTGNDWLDGGASNDVLGGDLGDDTLLGGDGYDVLLGGAGNDNLSGGEGIDVLQGHAGDDVLHGNAGHDVLAGGLGNDTLIGGTGADSFVITPQASSTDVIEDFSVIESGERIDLTAFNGVAADFTAFSQTFIQNGDDTHISLAAGQTVILKNVQKETLTLEHFVGITPVSNQAPTLANFSAAVAPGQSLTLTSSQLSATDADDTATELTFTVVSLPNNGTLKLEGVDLGIFSSFTQQDILDGKLSFASQSGYSGLNKFDFILSDGINLSDKKTFYVAANSITGTNGHNTGGYEGALFGTASADLIHGLAGTDSLIGGSGDDLLYGDAGVTWTYAQAGNDIIFGGTGGESSFGNSQLYGYEGNDSLYGAAGPESISGDAGDDLLSGAAGNDTLYGGLGNDTYVFNIGDGVDNIYEAGGTYDMIRFGQGILKEDVIFTSTISGNVEITFANSATDKLIINGVINDNNMTGRVEKIIFSDGSVIGVPMTTFAGGQTVYGDSNTNLIKTGDGNDTVWAHAGNDVVFGEAGDDTVYGEHGDDVIDGGTGNDSVEGMWGNDIISGGEGNDYLNGSDGNDIINGDAGADTILGGDGADVLSGGLGNDVVYGQLGDDVYNFSIGDGSDWVQDSGGTDRILFASGLAASELMFTPVGAYDIELSFSAHPQDKILLSNIRAGASYRIEAMTFADGQEVKMPHFGLDVADQMLGGSDSDVFYGFAGNDVIQTSDGDDIVYAGDGDDTVNFGVYSYTGNKIIYGGAGSDSINAGSGNDQVWGGSGNDSLSGHGGNDIVHGDGGADYIHGEAGDDSLYGDDGDDFLFGEDGNDNLNGGAGSDTYVYASLSHGHDVISDYSGTADEIRFGAGIASSDVTLTDNGDDLVITFAGNAAASITLLGQNASGTGVVERLSFDDGSTISLVPVNPNPVAHDDTFSGNEETTIAGNVLSSNGNGPDVDLDGGTLTVASGTFTTVAGGTALVSGNGDFTYTPAANYSGPDSFDYTLYDGQGGSDTGTVSLTITAVNDAPTLANNGAALNQDTTLTLTTAMLSANDVDNSDTQLTFTLVSLPAHGSLKLNGAALALNGSFSKQDIAAGHVTFAPTPGYSGSDGISLVLSDGAAALSAAVFSISVNTTYSTITGTAAANVLNGTSGNNIIDALAGNDTIVTNNGIDIVYCGDGDDTVNSGVYGYTGDKIIYGGAGSDSINAGSGNDQVWGGLGNDSLSGHGGNDIVHGDDGADYVHGEAGNDVLYGDAGDDFLFGHIGNDTLYGGAGNDTLYGAHVVSQSVLTNIYGAHSSGIKQLYGGDGNDSLYGYFGNDILSGGNGADSLRGGGGADVFVFDDATAYSGVDTIYDFSKTEHDALNIADLLGAYDPMQNSINDFLSMTTSGGNTTVKVDKDGTGTLSAAQSVVTINGQTWTSIAAMIADGSLIIDA